MAKTNWLIVLAVIAVFREGSAVLWPCESNNDCTADGSTCSLQTGLCECEGFDSVFSEDYTKCLKTSLFGDTCEATVQCNLMPSGANCKSGVCDCADGHTYVRGRCRPLNGLDHSCNTDLDCYFAYDRQSVACQNQVCVCANGYYQRNGNICRRKSMEIGDACVVDTDCDELGPNSRCRNLVCKLVDEIRDNSSSTIPTSKTKTETSNTSEATSQLSKSSQSETDKTDKTPQPILNGGDDLAGTDFQKDLERSQRLREIAVQTSIEAFELKPLIALKNVATTTTASTSTSSRRPSRYRRRLSGYRQDDEDKTLSTLSNTDDDADDKKYGSSCTENGKSCLGLPHSICSSSICLCRQGYYHKNEKCMAELGEIAETEDECEYLFDDLSKKCICQKNFFYERSLRACRKPIQFHLSCTSNSQCSPFGAAYCHPEIPRRCTCDEYAEYDALRQMCVYKQGLGAQCDTNDGCPVANSFCSNRYCVCKQNYFEKDNACAAGVGAECEADVDCEAKNSVCGESAPNNSSNIDEKERACQCRKGFVHFKDECLKEAEEIEEECIETEQCKPLLATCVDKKCNCTPEQHFKYGRCEDKKGLGEACSKAGECFVEKDQQNVECRNSVCQCKFGYQTDVEHKGCIRVMPNKKNSSGRPSALKIITFLLIGSAFLITSAAIKQAYY